MSMSWDGITERRKSPSDHDNLTRALVILETHVKNFESHIIEDKKNFAILFRAYWFTIGAIFFLEFLIKFSGN